MLGSRTFAVLFWVVLSSVSLTGDAVVAQQENQRLSSEYYLPANTRAWISVPDLQTLNAHMEKSQMGQLAKDPVFKPFIDGARKQVKNWLDDKGVKFEFSLDDLGEIKTGEVSIAGVLPEGKAVVAGSHGVVLMVDASEDLDGIKALINRVDGKLIARGATKEILEINGIKVTKWAYPEKRKWAKRKRVSFQAVVDGWLLVSDNDKIFRQVLRRVTKLVAPDGAGNLASQQSFKYALSRCNLGAGDADQMKADMRWFVEPFGYVKLARAIEIENEPVKKMEDDWTAVLAANGLKAIRSIAGGAVIATDDKEAFFRLFVHAPKKEVRDEAEARMLRILDFAPYNIVETTPPKWVPKSVSGSLTMQWDFSKALAGVGPIVDSFLKEEGAFEDLMNTIKVEPDFRVDIPKLVGQLDKRFTLISETVKPLDVESEKLAIGIKLVDGMAKADEKDMIESIQRAIRGKKINLGGFDVIVDDRTKEVEDEEDFDFSGDDLPFGDDDLPFGDEEDENKFGGGGGGANQAFTLFEKKFIAIAKGHIFICNDKDYLKRLLTSKDPHPLEKEADFIKMREVLAKYVELENVRGMRFSRIDKVLELNYDMIKKGELANSKSLLGKIFGSMMAQKSADGEPAKVKLDVDKLPDDYEAAIAKYLGTMGWMLENETGGWRITGGVLRK